MDGPSAPLSDKLGTKTFDSGAAMTTYCYARDYQGQHRKTHKPAPGKYDGEPIVSCAWCGKGLTQEAADTQAL